MAHHSHNAGGVIFIHCIGNALTYRVFMRRRAKFPYKKRCVFFRDISFAVCAQCMTMNTIALYRNVSSNCSENDAKCFSVLAFNIRVCGSGNCWAPFFLQFTFACDSRATHQCSNIHSTTLKYQCSRHKKSTLAASWFIYIRLSPNAIYQPIFFARGTAHSVSGYNVVATCMSLCRMSAKRADLLVGTRKTQYTL